MSITAELWQANLIALVSALLAIKVRFAELGSMTISNWLLLQVKPRQEMRALRKLRASAGRVLLPINSG